MREEQNVGVLQGLVDVSMGHQFLVGEPLIGFIFLVLSHNFRGDKVHTFSYYLRYDELKLLDAFVHHLSPLEGCYNEVSHYFAILVRNC